MAVGSESSPIVLWDLDGTLVELRIGLADVAAWKRRLEEHFGPRGWAGGWSPLLPSLENALDAVGADIDERARAYAEIDEAERLALAGVDVHDHVLRIAADVDAAGVPQAIVTNNGRPAVDAALGALRRRADALGVAMPAFAAVVVREPGRRAKPAPDILHRAVDATVGQRGASTGPVVMIGDSPADAQAAAKFAAERRVEVVFVGASAGRLAVDPAAEARLRALGLAALLRPESAPRTPG